MQPLPDSNHNSESRRSFIKKTATLTASVAATGIIKTPVYGQNQAPSTGRVIGANDRISVGYIGTGAQGTAHIRHEKTNAQEYNIVQEAVGDLYKNPLYTHSALLGVPDSDAYTDHRKLLERKDIDAVVIATVDNWHEQ